MIVTSLFLFFMSAVGLTIVLWLFRLTQKLYAIFGLIAVGTYFVWRFNFTILPYSEDAEVLVVWMYLYLLVEFFSVSEYFQSGAFSILKRRTRKAVEGGADPRKDALQDQSIDLIIPTLDEPVDLLRKTLICAIDVHHENLTVNLLDDGCRHEVKLLAEELGVTYFSRESSEGAKAGNMNAALPHLKGRFVAILDADFLAFRNFIRIGLPFFEDRAVGCVQFPQVFYNSDVTQTGSKLYEKFRDEQWAWFHDKLVARDGCGLATSCGSCSIIDRQALDLVGGKFPEETITEDFDLSLRLLDVGKETRYVNKTVAIGLQAHTVDDFFRQRKRWILGNASAMQWAFKRSGKLPIWKKILIADWRLIEMPARIITLLAPSGFLLFGVLPLKVESLLEYLLFTIPFLFIVSLNEWQTSDKSAYVWFLQQARTTGVAINIGLEIVLQTFIRKSAGFDVTNKVAGSRISSDRARKIIFLIFCVSLVALVSGLVRLRIGENDTVLNVALVWQGWNLALVMAAFLIFTDRVPKRNSSRLIPVSKQTCTLVTLEGSFLAEAEIQDISEGGIRFCTSVASLPPTFRIRLAPDEVITRDMVPVLRMYPALTGHLVRLSTSSSEKYLVQVKFDYSADVSNWLTNFIYTGKFAPTAVVNMLRSTEGSQKELLILTKQYQVMTSSSEPLVLTRADGSIDPEWSPGERMANWDDIGGSSDKADTFEPEAVTEAEAEQDPLVFARINRTEMDLDPQVEASTQERVVELGAQIDQASGGDALEDQVEDLGYRGAAFGLGDDDSVLDEEVLREIIAQVIREELQGVLGQRITRNVRKMVRREIRLALTAEELE